MTDEMAIDAFNKALVNQELEKDKIFHSDRGSQYTSTDYEKVLRLMVLLDAKRYNDKTLRLGVITLDLESALLCRVNRIKEAKNELCNI